MPRPALVPGAHRDTEAMAYSWEQPPAGLVDWIAGQTSNPAAITAAQGAAAADATAKVAAEATARTAAIATQHATDNASYPSATVVAGAGIDVTGVADSTAAVTALCAPNRWLHFPPGAYLLGGVELATGMRVTFDPGATVTVKSGGPGFTVTGSIGAPVTLADTKDLQNTVSTVAANPFAVGDVLYIVGAPTLGASAKPYGTIYTPPNGFGAWDGKTTYIRRVLAVTGTVCKLDGPLHVDMTAPTACKITPKSDVTISGAVAQAQSGTSTYFVQATYTVNLRLDGLRCTNIGTSTGYDLDTTLTASRYTGALVSHLAYRSTRFTMREVTISASTAPYSIFARFVNAVDAVLDNVTGHRPRFVATLAGQGVNGFLFEAADNAPATIACTLRQVRTVNGGSGTTPGNGRGGIMLLLPLRCTVDGADTTGGDIGVYLSTYPYQNRVVNSRCTKHYGYYGTGILFDSCVYNNQTADNHCSYNGTVLPLDAGSTVATLDSLTNTEGYGIEWRGANFHNSSCNDITNNNALSGKAFTGVGGYGVVTGGQSNSNGQYGVVVDGGGTSYANNYLVTGSENIGNGTAATAAIGTAYGLVAANNI